MITRHKFSAYLTVFKRFLIEPCLLIYKNRIVALILLGFFDFYSLLRKVQSIMNFNKLNLQSTKRTNMLQVRSYDVFDWNEFSCQKKRSQTLVCGVPQDYQRHCQKRRETANRVRIEQSDRHRVSDRLMASLDAPLGEINPYTHDFM